MYTMTVDAARAESAYRQERTRHELGEQARSRRARRAGWARPHLHLGLHLRHS